MVSNTHVLSEPLGIIGSGAAGLITAYTLLQDGFTNVQIITRDKSPGGVWAKENVYPGLVINNVHGEFRFSALQMAPPSNAALNGRLSGEDMCNYMGSFAEKFLSGIIRFETEVVDIKREQHNASKAPWHISVKDGRTGLKEILKYSRIVVCTGGCNMPSIPTQLSSACAAEAKFQGPVFHSTQFGTEVKGLLSHVHETASKTDLDKEVDSIVVVGCGKSGQDIAAYLTTEGRKVTVVFDSTNAVLAATRPLPDFLRKSRCLSVLSPHIELRTRLERFLHTTKLGSLLVHGFWNLLAESSLDTLNLPKDSPLRNTSSIFWGVRSNDEGVVRSNGFYSLVNAGKIQVVSPARVERFGDNGRSVVLNDGQHLKADAVILSTGYSSSWGRIFDEQTAEDIGIRRHPPERKFTGEWNYASLANPPSAPPDSEQWASSIYRGIVPAKNITCRDFAVNGALFTTNNGYAFEVISHWISSYFLGDDMRLPSTSDEAFEHTERNSAWLRRRYPGALPHVNESYSSGISFWNWPQAIDELLEDMKLPNMRSGGNWLTWPFQVIDLAEISTLGEERKANRVVSESRK
ncbi:FAD/NAD(P)-binding domain-containing protein [Ramaria rubella]|nr:FAD/NAD(P)-binding domain-containing protein [Ramaria rubella]